MLSFTKNKKKYKKKVRSTVKGAVNLDLTSSTASVVSLYDSDGTTCPQIHSSPDMDIPSSDDEYFLDVISPNQTVLSREATKNKTQCLKTSITNTTTSAGSIGTHIKTQQQLDNDTQNKQQQNSTIMATVANTPASNINLATYNYKEQTANTGIQQQKLSNMALPVDTSVGNIKPVNYKNNQQATITNPQQQKPTPNLAPSPAHTPTKASNTKRSLIHTIANIQVTGPVPPKLPTAATTLFDDVLLTPSKRKRIELDSSDDHISLFESIKTPAFKSNAAKSIQQARRNSQSLTECQLNTQQLRQSFIDHQNKNKRDSDRNVGEIPPLFIPNVDAILPLLEKLKNMPGIGSYVVKCASNGVRIISSCLSTYNTILNTLNEAGTHLYSHQMRKDRGLRVVLRHLHHSTPTEWIAAKLAEVGYKTRFIKAIKNNFTNKPYNLFEVVIEPKPDGSHLKILQLQQLGLQLIKVERQAAPTDPAQCHRCQVFGHTKNYCRRPFVCMKCAGCHPTTTCLKKREEASKCANCKGNHISSYKGCPSFKEARRKLLHSRQMHHAKTNNLQTHLQHTQQYHQAARRPQMPSPPATAGHPTSPTHVSASASVVNDRPSFSEVLRSPVIETAPLPPASERPNRNQQPAPLHLQIRKTKNDQHQSQLADEKTQRPTQQQVSNSELFLALQNSIKISKLLEEKVNKLSETVYSVLMTLMREKHGSPIKYDTDLND